MPRKSKPVTAERQEEILAKKRAAVKKCREKSRTAIKNRQQNVQFLKESNTQLETEIKEVESKIEKLKLTLLEKVGQENFQNAFKDIMEADTDEEVE